MPVTERMASVTLEGDLRVTTASVSGTRRSYGELPSSLVERLNTDNDKTSPEELIASAYAADYAMQLATTLSSHGNQPERLDVKAKCVLDRNEDGLAITRMQLEVKGIVPRLDSNDFEAFARKAEERCLVSTAMQGNVEFELNAELVTP